jgi:hypothetical protein
MKGDIIHYCYVPATKWAASKGHPYGPVNLWDLCTSAGPGLLSQMQTQVNEWEYARAHASVRIEIWSLCAHSEIHPRLLLVNDSGLESCGFTSLIQSSSQSKPFWPTQASSDAKGSLTL